MAGTAGQLPSAPAARPQLLAKAKEGFLTKAWAAEQTNGSSGGLAWPTLVLRSSRLLLWPQAGEHPSLREEGQRTERLGAAEEFTQPAACSWERETPGKTESSTLGPKA